MAGWLVVQHGQGDPAGREFLGGHGLRGACDEQERYEQAGFHDYPAEVSQMIP